MDICISMSVTRPSSNTIEAYLMDDPFEPAEKGRRVQPREHPVEPRL